LAGKKADPTILQFYPDTWQVVITKAKISFQRYLVLFNGFPNQAKHLSEAGSLLTSAIQEGENQGLILDPSQCHAFVVIMAPLLIVLHYPAFSQSRHMNIVMSTILLLSFYTEFTFCTK